MRRIFAGMLLSEYAIKIGDLLSHLPLLVSLHYLGKHEPQKFGLYSDLAYRE